MIEIIDKHNCCGCSACVQTCPKQCIAFSEDEQGFRYPFVDKDNCIDCHLCEKVCPFLNQNEKKKPLEVYAAINPDEDVRMKSSSGGIFTMIAEAVIAEGGVVFGAQFNMNWGVVHNYTETIEGLDTLRGSKYVQSIIGESYNQAKRFLNEGRKVLFSGTQCQIAGLNHFLGKEYDNLLTVDVICHGVPSPMVWRDYLSNRTPNTITSISMKDKHKSWRNYNITFVFQNFVESKRTSKDAYMLAFIKNLSLRPSCFNCPAKNGKSNSDITLGDFWGIEHVLPEMDDDKGTSIVCANTAKGIKILKGLSAIMRMVDYEKSVPYNTCIVKSTTEPINRSAFWESYRESGGQVMNALLKKTNILKKIFRKIKQII